jgi:hypothetical protein
LTLRYGSIRSWREMMADPRARTIAERLLLLGWLLPRPATPRHPARYLLPPELRRWLPQPLDLESYGPASAPPLPLALRAAAAVLLTCAERPLAVRADGAPRRATLRLLVDRLAPLSMDDSAPLIAWLLALLVNMGLVAVHAGGCALAPAGQRFLNLAPADQIARLQQAWIRAPQPDSWLAALLIDRMGIDWPLLRRRLCDWATALPTDQLLDSASLYDRLSAAFGPLADAQTHGFRTVDRAPWQPRRAAAIFDAALRGPLAWLGLVAWTDQPPTTNDQRPTPIDSKVREPRTEKHPEDSHPRTETSKHQLPTPNPQPSALRSFVFRSSVPIFEANSAPWRYGEQGELVVPHTSVDADLLRILPFARWQAADETAITLRFSREDLLRAAGKGWSDAMLWAVLEQRAGPPPDGWRERLAIPLAGVRLVQAAVVVADPPAVLERASRARSVRRYLDTCLAPGIALAQPEHIAPLVRALARQDIVVAPPPARLCPPPAALTPAECASLLLACAFYRRHAPPGAPLVPHDLLEDRLRAALTPQLRTATDVVLTEARPRAALLGANGVALAAQPTDMLLEGDNASNKHRCSDGQSEEPASVDAATLPLLRAALAAQRPITITYDTAGRGAWSRRFVRPLRLEQRNDSWYLHAYCSTRNAERVFRVDRIGTVRRE